MRLDPLTLVAQLVNFALLVLLLWRLLFRPVATTLRDREERIRSQMQRADQARVEAEQQEEAAREERERLERDRGRHLQELEQEVERRRSELLERARTEAEREHEKQLGRLAEERAQATIHLRREAGRLLTAALARGLEDLAGRSLQEAVLARFEERLAGLPQAERATLRSGAQPWTLATAQPLDPAVREALLDAIARGLDEEVEVRVVHEPGLVAGLELRAGDLSLGWSVRHLVDDLARRFESRAADELNRSGPDDRGAELDDVEEVG
ncbi:MAG: F0F1 ATP synthase subunit delta [Deinococcales bacterium]